MRTITEKRYPVKVLFPRREGKCSRGCVEGHGYIPSGRMDSPPLSPYYRRQETFSPCYASGLVFGVCKGVEIYFELRLEGDVNGL